jgi:SAM-dependent methyltransferase
MEAMTSRGENRYDPKNRRGLFHPLIALRKRSANLRLVEAWAPPSRENARILKTDLFEEAHGEDAILDDFARRWGFAAGIEVSPRTAALANDRFRGLPIIATSVAAIPFRPASFETILSNSTLDHLRPAEFERALAELARILKPGGVLILTLDNRHNPLHVFSHWVRRLFGWFYTDRCYTVDEAAAALRRHGFRVTDATAVFHVPFPVNFLAKTASRLFGRGIDPGLERLLDVFDRWERLGTKFLTGRHIALRAVKKTDR